MEEHYTDTIFYQIELTAKYCRYLGTQAFDKYNTGITIEEYTALDTLCINSGLCQRDLAKLILKDRANTGKLLDGLEQKGYIERKLSIRNNRPVKIIELTKSGRAKAEEVAARIRPDFMAVKEKINNSDIAKVGDLLKEFRKVLSESLEIQI